MAESGRYKIKTLSEMTGLGQALLRAWERRYGLLQPQRTPGGHRLYTQLILDVKFFFSGEPLLQQRQLLFSLPGFYLD